MNRLTLSTVALLLLLSGVAGFMIPNAQASGDKPAAEEEGVPVISYIAMDPIILPIIDRQGISQTISIVISLQVAGAAMAENVKLHLPKLTDAYLSDMYGTLSKAASMESGVIKVSMLKSRLKNVTKKIMPDGEIQDVLLQVLQQHPV